MIEQAKRTRRSRKPAFETVAFVNGFQIERERSGAAVYWNAIKCNSDGYQIAGFRNCGSKRAAIAKAEGR